MLREVLEEKYQTFIMGNNITCTIYCSHWTAATCYTFETLFYVWSWRKIIIIIIIIIILSALVCHPVSRLYSAWHYEEFRISFINIILSFIHMWTVHLRLLNGTNFAVCWYCIEVIQKICANFCTGIVKRHFARFHKTFSV